MKKHRKKEVPQVRRSRPRLSVSMIVRNEERFLAGCLESIQGIADEIVVVDTGSNDSTISIAEKFGASVFHFPWVGDFAAARNESLQHCTGDWILYLDADERLQESSREELLRIINNRNAVAYDCLLSCEEKQPKGRVHNIAPYPRLFRRMHQFRFEGKVHEQIVYSIRRSGFAILPSNVVIEHLGYAQSSEILVEKCKRNAEMLRRQLAEHPDDIYSRFQLGNTLAILCQHEEAIAELEQVLRVPHLHQRIRSSVQNVLASIALYDRQYARALEHVSASLETAPGQVSARWIATRAWIALKDFAKALPLFEQIKEIQKDRAGSGMMEVGFDAQIPGEEICFWKGICLQQTGASEEAANEFFAGLRINAAFPAMRELYIRCVETLRNPEVHVRQLRWLLDTQGDSVNLLNCLARVHLKTNNPDDARVILDRCSNSGLQDDDTRGLWIEYYLAKGEVACAQRSYEAAVVAKADSHEYHRAALNLMLLIKDLARAVQHVEGMSRGITTKPGENIVISGAFEQAAHA